MPNSMWGKFDLQLNKTRVKEFVDQVIIENLQVSSTRNHKTMDHPGIKQHPAKARMEWTFTLEVAPWWVGIFDRVVNLMTVLSYEEWMTVVVEVEMILSCRPLSYVSCKDPEEPHRTPKVANVLSLPTLSRHWRPATGTKQENAAPEQRPEPLLEEIEKNTWSSR